VRLTVGACSNCVKSRQTLWGCTGVYKAGGGAALQGNQLQQCIEATKLRYNELKTLLNQSLADKGISPI
jgi:hypothetical protein